MNRIKQIRLDFNPVIRATEGLVLFREGNLAAGRECYKQAIHRANETNRKDITIRARAHLLEEEFAAGNFDVLQEIEEIRGDFRKTKNKSLIAEWDGIERHLRAMVTNAGVNFPNLEDSSQTGPSHETQDKAQLLLPTSTKVRE